jgi:hypothetical protein
MIALIRSGDVFMSIPPSGEVQPFVDEIFQLMSERAKLESKLDIAEKALLEIYQWGVKAHQSGTFEMHSFALGSATMIAYVALVDMKIPIPSDGDTPPDSSMERITSAPDAV